MIRHTSSLVISLLIHLILFGALLVSIDSVVSLFSQKKEHRVCVNLCCKIEHEIEHEIESPLRSKKVEKIQKNKTPKKRKVEPNNIPVKQTILPKKTLKSKPQKTEPKQDMGEVLETKSEPPTRKKSRVVVTPQKSVVIREETPVSAEKKYVDNNIVQIAKLLQENLYYPRRARKRGLEGEVIVRFVLLADAKVSSVKVLSSTNDILSRAAIKTIENLSLKFPKPTEKLTLSVPILYKLN